MPSIRPRSGGPNFLGAKYAPFVVSSDPNSKNFRVRDVELPSGIDDPRFQGLGDKTFASWSIVWPLWRYGHR
ncbi:MAG: hypothetical protein U0905_16570 [Pirellulales bacterium]